MRKIREILRLKHEQGLSHRAISPGVPHRRRHDHAVPAADGPARDRLAVAGRGRRRRTRGPTARTSTASASATASPCNSSGRSTPRSIRYRQWARRLRPSMRQVHRAGEKKTFIDFSGKRPTLVDPRTGEARRVELFVAVLGASGLTVAEAPWPAAAAGQGRSSGGGSRG